MGPLSMPCAKKIPQHATTTYQIRISIYKKPWGFVFKLGKAPI
jgi:hypothetical protein